MTVCARVRACVSSKSNNFERNIFFYNKLFFNVFKYVLYYSIKVLRYNYQKINSLQFYTSRQTVPK